MEKVFLFKTDEVADCFTRHIQRVFSTMGKALDAFNEWKEKQLSYAEEDGWTIETNEKYEFEAFEDDNYDDAHSFGEIVVMEVE